MIVSGSNNYSYSGRKRNTVRKVKKAPVAFKPLTSSSEYRRDTPDYASVDAVRVVLTPDDSFRKEISATYTVAPASNNGAYQVIPRENVKDIGR